MNRRRTVAMAGLASVTGVAAIVSLGPRALTTVDHLRTAAGDPASTTSALAFDPRWVEPVTGWPSALAADRAGAIVLAGNGEVRSLDPDGNTRWRVELPGAALHPPALDRSTVLVGAGARVVAFERETGATRWAATLPDSAAGPVVVAGDQVLAATEAGALVGFDARTGETRWSIKHPGSIRSAPVVIPSHDAKTPDVVVAAWHGGDDPRLRGVDLLTGGLRWDAPLLRFASAPIASGGLVVIGEGDGQYAARVVARSAVAGVEAWSTPVPASFESGITPGAAGADIAVVDHFGTVSVLDATTGAVRTRTALDEPVLHTTVLIGAAHLVLTTHQGAVVVIDRASGRTRYRGSPGGYPAGIARRGPDLLVAVRLRQPGRVESIRLPLH